MAPPRNWPIHRLAIVAILSAVAPLLGGCGSQPGAGEALSSGVLRVGTEGTYAPFSYHNPANGQLVGYDVDVVWQMVKADGGFNANG